MTRTTDTNIYCYFIGYLLNLEINRHGLPYLQHAKWKAFCLGIFVHNSGKNAVIYYWNISLTSCWVKDGWISEIIFFCSIEHWTSNHTCVASSQIKFTDAWNKYHPKFVVTAYTSTPINSIEFDPIYNENISLEQFTGQRHTQKINVVQLYRFKCISMHSNFNLIIGKCSLISGIKPMGLKSDNFQASLSSLDLKQPSAEKHTTTENVLLYKHRWVWPTFFDL